jgi:hypothetical protein
VRISSISFLIAVLLGLWPYQQDSPSMVFTQLQERATSARATLETDPDDARLAGEINNAVSNLKTRWEQSSRRELPSDYSKTLEFDTALLNQALSETDIERRTELLNYVNDDLQLKNEQARRTLGASGALGASIRVTVKTIKSGQAVNGYLARCNPKRFADLQTPMFVFNNETNPTTVRNLPPGNYEMWVEKPSGTKVLSKPITIGGDGRTSRVITFEVP